MKGGDPGAPVAAAINSSRHEQHKLSMGSESGHANDASTHHRMKFTAQTLSALAAAGLLMGAIGSPAALADKKDKTIIDYIDANLKAIDEALIKIFTPPKK